MTGPTPGMIVGEALRMMDDWCAIRSTADRPDDLRRMAARVASYSRDCGAEIVPDALARDPPIIHARLRGRGPRVVLYNMYDVMPADPSGWQSDPWRAEIIDLPAYGRCVVARGAENNKGPLAVMLATLAALRHAGRLACEIEILVEGQEECGSATLRRYLAVSPCPVAAAFTVLFPSLCEYGGGPPRLYLGFKGIAHGVIRCAAGDWGGPAKPAHSSNAPWLANPAWQLLSALVQMGEPPTGRFDSIHLDDESAGLVAALAGTFDPQRELAFRAASRFAVTGDAEVLLTRVLAEASLNISGLSCDGAPATIPSAAEVRIEIRTPPGLDPWGVIDELRERVRAKQIDGVAVDIADAYAGRRFCMAAPGVAAALDAYRASGAEPQIWPWAVGAAPAYAFAPVAPSFLIFGLGRGGNAHAPNEFATIAGLERLAASLIAILDRLAVER
jgi:cysteinylglycine-S-conjugate dipeptidase